MTLYKICPTCDKKNNINSYLCDNCMADISSIEHTGLYAMNKLEELNDVQKILLVTNDFSLELYDGEVLGREHSGKHYFQNINTISRKHASVHFENSKWFIKDLNSANGVYINGYKIVPETLIAIKNGDVVSLSLKYSGKIST